MKIKKTKSKIKVQIPQLFPNMTLQFVFGNRKRVQSKTEEMTLFKVDTKNAPKQILNFFQNFSEYFQNSVLTSVFTKMIFFTFFDSFQLRLWTRILPTCPYNITFFA